MSPLTQQQPLKVLLAVDGSEHARAAVALLRDLPLPAGSAIDTRAVLIPREAGFRYNPLTEALQHASQTLAHPDLQVTADLLSGYPAEQLMAHADEHRPDLIVMGAQGLRATLGILLGGVAQQIVEHAACPVLVVRAPYDKLERILAAADGSPCGRQALAYLARFPLPSGASVEVIHVVPPLPVYIDLGEIPIRLTPAMTESLARQAEEEQRQGEALLAESLEVLKAAGMPARSVLRRGDAATEIIEQRKESGADLIVAGVCGFSQLKGLRLGNVARKLVHYAGCSVLLTKEAG